MKGIKEKFNKLKEKFLDEIFPENFSCAFCNAELKKPNKYLLCDDCLSNIKPIEYACKICGDELNSFTTVCENCKNRKRYFDYATSATTYDGIAKEMVHKLKYNGCVYFAKTIGRFLATKFHSCKFDLIDLVICVPINKEKLKIRGFNQAEEILKEFVKHYGFDYSTTCLIRVKDTTTQTKLTRKQRIENLRNAFEVTDPSLIYGKNILVIDDVITTGSTLDEVAKVLKENGSKQVFGLSFCHTPLNRAIEESKEDKVEKKQ